MKWFKNASIRRKQMLIILLTCSVVLILACAGFSIYERISFRNTMKKNLATLADIVDHNVAAALDFNDSKSAEETLSALQADPTIIGAWLYGKNGEAFAKYDRPDDKIVFTPPVILPNGTIFQGRRLILCRPVVVKGESMGTLYLETDMQALDARLTRFALITGLVFVVSWLIAFALSSRLQRLVSDPILQLAKVTRSVALEKNYSVRAVKQSTDELGQLIDGFNEMLAQIQERDAALGVARESLEKRVEERTAELRRKTALFEALVNSSLDAIMVVDGLGQKVVQNQQTNDLWKIPKHIVEASDDKLQVQHVMNATKDPEAFVRRVRQLYSNSDEISREEVELKDGRVLDRYSAPVRGKDGEYYGRIWMFRDVTERKKAEAELAYERDLFNVVLEASPDSIYFKDLESRFVRLSKSKLEESLAFCRDQYRTAHPGSDAENLPEHLAGLEQFAKYMAGKTDFDFYTKESARILREEEQQIIRTGDPIIGKLDVGELPDGGITWHLSSKVPWKDKEGRIIGTFGISKNITAIKKAEAELETVHKQLLETSRQAGMAEVATSVLHNVGNVLNSVNVSATLVADNTKKSKAPYLGKVVALLNEHAADLGAFMTQDPKGRQLPGYLSQLAGQLVKEQQSAIAELETLRKNIEHIKDIVAMQQSYAKVSGVTETINVTELVEDALRMNAAALSRHEVEVVREYAEVPPVTIEKHKVIQVLVNLIRNAKYACDDSGRSDKRMTMRVASGDNRVTISISDNGVGIPAENLTRIFNHGFTTRKEGHGFGLHSGALAARELGGSLTARSDGPGRGASFTLELPQTPPTGDTTSRRWTTQEPSQ